MKTCVLVGVIAVLLASCASWGDGVGPWQQFREDDYDAEQMRRYGMPDPGALSDGLDYWQFTNRMDEPPYALSWEGRDTVRLWVPKTGGSDRYTVTVSTCEGLRASIERMLAAMGESARIVADPNSIDSGYQNQSIYAGGIVHQVKYTPWNMLGSVSLRSFLGDHVTWIDAVMDLRTRAERCAGVVAREEG